MSSGTSSGLSHEAMNSPSSPLVHLELHTQNAGRALAFYTGLFGWATEVIEVPRGSYQAIGLGDGIEGGVIECRAPRPLWLPYVGVADAAEATARAQEMGASVLLSPREGPAGWRSVIAAPAGGEVALWQPKS
jgi:predicted enzyme related to lactoylglutathione lyase